jgi:hypothetical protein
VSVKVGNKGSEHTLAGHVTMGRLGALYLHTERFGTWLQRRLVPRGYESMVTELRVHDSRLWWQVWHPRDSWTRGTPWWRHGSARLDPWDLVLGAKRYTYEPAAGPAMVEVHAGPGESYAVEVKLRRCSLGRPGRRQQLSWSVECTSAEPVVTRPGKGGMVGWSVELGAGQAESPHWAEYAAMACCARIAEARLSSGYIPPAMVEDC